MTMISKQLKYRLCFMAATAAFLVGCSQSPQEPRTVGLEDLQAVIKSPGDGIRIINFWATWCAPCIKEMPLLEKLGKERQDIEITLVSLDLDLDPNPDKVKDFVKERGILLPVLILDAGNPNEWIDKIDSNWSGALPTTMLV